MSLNMSDLPNKRELPTHVSPPTTTTTNSYQIKSNRLIKQILRKIKATNKLPARVRVAFLTEEDKAQIKTDICDKGYECSEENGILIIS